MSFTDFKNGLQDVNDYLDARHHISGTTGSQNDVFRTVVQAEYSFTLRELLCGLLSGNGLKLPNVQLCLYSNINSLLNIPGLQNELQDALNQLKGNMEQFMDHTKLDEVLGRLNGVLAEAQNVANLINFCSQPVDPIAIPNMLERAMGSFLGAGQSIVNDIGGIIPDEACACISLDGSFNANVFNGGVLGRIAGNINAITSGSLIQSELDAITNDIKGIGDRITGMINFENNINGSYSLGGSNFATPDSGCNTQIGVLHNSNTGGVAGNARLMSQLKSLYDTLGGYPVQYSLGEGGSVVGTQFNGTDANSANRVLSDDVIEYPNIFHLLLDQELLDIIENADDPQPDVSTQTPVYDYCGAVIGYTTTQQQTSSKKSEGTTPTAPTNNQGQNHPGYQAGGLPTNSSNIAGTGSSGETTIINNFNNTGNTLFVVGSEAAQNSLSANENDIVVRTDILTIFTRKNTSNFNTGTIADFEQSTFTALEFLSNLNNEAGSGIVVKDAGVSRARQVIGGTGQIKVTNGDGAGGDIQIDLEENPRFPGTAAIKIPAGTTAQRPNTEVGEIRNNTDTHVIEGYFGDTSSWRSISTTSTGGVNNASNLGGGSGVFKLVNGSELQFRTLVAQNGIVVTENADTITIDENITSSNIGSGSQIFKQRTSNNFEFRTVISTDNSIVITQNADTVDLSADPNTLKATTQTTDATATAVQFNGSFPEPASTKTWFFSIMALGVSTVGERQAFEVKGVVEGGTPSLVGTNAKVDYQRSTADIGVALWDPMASYVSGDVVEYDLNTYTANAATISGGAAAPDTNTDWTVTYEGWNVNAEVIGGAFRIRVKGSTGKTVNWNLRLTFLEV